MYFYRHHQTYKSRVTKTFSQLEIWKTTMFSKVVSGMFRSSWVDQLASTQDYHLCHVFCSKWFLIGFFGAWSTQFTRRVPTAWTAWSQWSPSQEWCDLRSADADQRHRLGRPWDRLGKILPKSAGHNWVYTPFSNESGCLERPRLAWPCDAGGSFANKTIFGGFWATIKWQNCLNKVLVLVEKHYNHHDDLVSSEKTHTRKPGKPRGSFSIIALNGIPRVIGSFNMF